MNSRTFAYEIVVFFYYRIKAVDIVKRLKNLKTSMEAIIINFIPHWNTKIYHLSSQLRAIKPRDLYVKFNFVMHRSKCAVTIHFLKQIYRKIIKHPSQIYFYKPNKKSACKFRQTLYFSSRVLVSYNKHVCYFVMVFTLTIYSCLCIERICISHALSLSVLRSVFLYRLRSTGDTTMEINDCKRKCCFTKFL